MRAGCVGVDPGTQLNAVEKKRLADRQAKYYIDNWHKVLLPIFGCRKAQVACPDTYTLEKLTSDCRERVFFSAAWVKPGRNFFTV